MPYSLLSAIQGQANFRLQSEPLSFGSLRFGQIFRMCFGAFPRPTRRSWDERLNGHNCVALPLHCFAVAPDELFAGLGWGGLISETLLLDVAGALYPLGSPEQEKQKQMREFYNECPLALSE
ncbi:hypothetical protein QQF64_004943 [Cirrhinus molitorella]|uniref:Uncharacterized protein n=1 Tax=Cirrhinus molitorella TaxID=172907 RepID=A0ABR3MKJ9_9TELE